jgi:hypothetical protein
MQQRQREPQDPELLAISKVLPDRWLEDRWPQRRTQGRRQPLPIAAMVRIHLLALIKALGSFNAACKELRHNTDFRRFCRLAPGQIVPTPSYLSRLREACGLELWHGLHRHLLKAVATLNPPSAAGLVVPDATDLPAAVRRTSKKKTNPPCRGASARRAPRVGRAAARAVNPTILWATKNTASTASCARPTGLRQCR